MKTSTFFTFVNDQCGKAEEAMKFYISIFPNSEIKRVVRYAEGEAGGDPGHIKIATFTLNGTEYLISENNYKHAWSFSPGVSVFVKCNTEEETQTLFEQLSQNGGKIMVPLGDYGFEEYGFGKKFGWCEDRYGVSWQLIQAE